MERVAVHETEGAVRMTLKAFSEKYGLSYHMVFNASYNVQKRATVERDNDFPEIELLGAVNAIISGKIEKLSRMIDTHVATLNRINSIGIK